MVARLFTALIIAAVMAGCGGPTPAPVAPVPAAVDQPTGEVPAAPTKLCTFTLTNGVQLQGLIVADNKKDVIIQTEDGEVTIARERLAGKPAPAELPPTFDQAPAPVAEGMESLPGWSLPADWGNTGTVVAEKTAGNVRLRVKADGGASEKMVIQVAAALDLSANAVLTLDVFNPTQVPAVVAVAFRTGEGKVYYEAEPREVAFGWSRGLAVDLAAAKFKSESTQWEYTAALADPAAVSEVFLLLYNGDQPAEVIVDNIVAQ